MTEVSRDSLVPGASVAVKFEGVNKVYSTKAGRVVAIEQLDLRIKPGEFLSIVGPSGCGKSTALLMLAGLIPSTRGNITIESTTVNGPYTELGIVFQDPVLLDWRTAQDNILLQMEMRDLATIDATTRAQDLLKQVNLEDFAGSYPYELSGGMRQRVAICRALIHEPPLLLMDEPFGALDALSRDQLNVDIQRLWMDTRPTVLFVTHSISEAVFLSDRVVVMSAHPGRIAAVIDVDISRPRRLGDRESEKFRDYAGQIREVFKTLGVLHEEDQ